MAAFLGIFALGMAGWWVLSIGFFIWIIWAVEKDSWVGSLFCIILYLLFLQYLGKTDLFGHTLQHPMDTLCYVLAYFVFGFGWSFIKWWLFVSKLAEKRIELRKTFIKEYPKFESAIPKHLRIPDPNEETEMDRKWDMEVSLNNLKKPTVTENKGKISIWVMYWPISLLWSLLNDLIKKIIKRLIIMFRKLYDSITNGAFKNVE